ncbi:ABC-three component system protein [Schaalia sp. lx-260]|uniref:ABC-three component system protein n=1 Tax=Schaalia sp. lx-260 TaxID=2899082 RepID=UPI001E3F3F3D|nr:ABC-three component system protein [Schaalia sp. lx-260]MCD4549138.1 hypothetical protein [Schaalia sp. lx-260]
MLVVDLLRLLHTNAHFTRLELEEQQAYSKSGGGWFIRHLADLTMKPESARKENNPFYFAQCPGRYEPEKEDKYLRTLQRYYSGEKKRLISKYRAQYWLSNLDRDRLLSYLETGFHLDRRQDWLEIFRANGFEVSVSKTPELIADLLTQGLANLAQGDPQINDLKWNPSLFEATKESLAEEDFFEVRFSSLKASDIFVADGMLHVGSRKVALPESFKCDDATKYRSRRFIDQACLAFSEDAGQNITVEEIGNAPEQYQEDYADYIQCFHTAMSILALMREVSVDGEEEFDRIKLDLLSALKPVLRRKQGNTYDKLNDALAESTRALLTKSHVPQTTGLFDNDARKGVCHSLADTSHITWVTTPPQTVGSNDE